MLLDAHGPGHPESGHAHAKSGHAHAGAATDLDARGKAACGRHRGQAHGPAQIAPWLGNRANTSQHPLQMPRFDQSTTRKPDGHANESPVDGGSGFVMNKRLPIAQLQHWLESTA